MSEYRAAIGMFACIARYSSNSRKRMSKKSKLVKLKKMEGEENNFMPNPIKSGKISRSLDRCGMKKRSYELTFHMYTVYIPHWGVTEVARR